MAPRIKVVFGRMDFKEDGKKKKKRKNKKGKLFGGCLVGRKGREGKCVEGSKFFFLEPTRKLSPKMGRKLRA